jgi:hypothetical protein
MVVLLGEDADHREWGGEGRNPASTACELRRWLSHPGVVGKNGLCMRRFMQRLPSGDLKTVHHLRAAYPAKK